MKTFVQYFQYGTVTGRLMEACGDRSIVILDGRNTLATLHADARRFNGYRRPNYPAYQLMRGDTFSRATPISSITITDGE